MVFFGTEWVTYSYTTTFIDFDGSAIYELVSFQLNLYSFIVGPASQEDMYALNYNSMKFNTVRQQKYFNILKVFNLEYQCWGKLLLKVMHYNIALLYKKATNYITFTVTFTESNAFLHTFCHLGWAYLFVFNNKNPKSYIFGSCKG